MSEKAVRILNVDDRDISRYVHEEMLRLEGFDVVSVANGADALAAARDDIDVVVLDVHLPDMDGFEVCRRLKSDPATSSAIVLMTSAAFVTAKNKIDGLEAGADGYLAQPYDTVEFSATLRALLRTRTAERRATALALELQDALERRDEFIAMVAHELRNPMAAISMALSIIELSHSDEIKTTKYHEVARRQMANLVRMVDDLLDVSRITRGTVDLRWEDLDLAALVQNAVNAIQPAIEARGHELSVTAVPGHLFVNADATRIEQVVVNLLNNAAKYTEPGGSVSVGLAREVENGAAMAVLRVRDTGRGIPEHMLEKVFDVFVQVSPAIDRSNGGMGMGLTLVKRLVELHGGTVSAHSDKPGKGSEFVVRLPLTPDAQARPDALFIDTSSPAVVSQGGGRRLRPAPLQALQPRGAGAGGESRSKTDA